MSSDISHPSLLKRMMTAVCMLGIVVLITTTAGSVDVLQSPPEPEPDGSVPRGDAVGGPLEVGEEYYGVEGGEAIFYWSRDEEVDPDDSDEIEWDSSDLNRDEPAENLTDAQLTRLLRAEAAVRDIASPGRPNTAEWNRKNLATYRRAYVVGDQPILDEANVPEPTDGTQSHHPIPRSELRASDKNLIRDAHATLFNIPGSLTTFQGTDVDRWVPSSGFVETMVDYRVAEPTKYLDAEFEWRKTYRIRDHEISHTCLHHRPGDDCETSEDQENIAEGYGTEVELLSYSGLDNKVPPEGSLTYVANITADYYVITERKMNGEFLRVNLTEESDYLLVNETFDYRYWNRNETEMKISRVEWPNGTVGFQFNFTMKEDNEELPPAAWSDISIGPTEIESEWRYVTWRDPTWDEMNISVGEGQEGGSYAPIATPVSTYLLPTGPPTTDGGRIEPNHIAAAWSENHPQLPVSTRRVPDGVNISIAGGSSGSVSRFSATDSIRVIHRNNSQIQTDDGYEPYDASSVDEDNVGFQPIIPGATGVATCPSPCSRQVYESRIDTEIVNETGGQYYVRVDVSKRDSGWEPIDGEVSLYHGQIYYNVHDGNGWVGGTDFNESGTTFITIPTDARGQVDVKYNQSISWYSPRLGSRYPELYTDTSSTVYLPSSNDPVSFLLYFFKVLWLPALVVSLLYVWSRQEVLLEHI